jgi:hypothetical protein
MGSRTRQLLLLVLLVAPAAACARGTLASSVVDAHGGGGDTAEMDFWDGLAAQRAVSNDDALHALLLSFGGAAESTDFAARQKAARARGWIGAGKDLTRNETARVGMIAKAVCIEAKIRGGLTMHVFGPSERYAVQELNYLKWLPAMSTNQAISGAQLIALLSQVEDHLAQAGPEPREKF